jgi:hypothetical protein
MRLINSAATTAVLFVVFFLALNGLPSISTAQVNIESPCDEGDSDRRTAFQYEVGVIGAAPANRPTVDVVALIQQLDDLRGEINSFFQDQHREPAPASTASSTAYHAVDLAAKVFRDRGDEMRNAADEYRELDAGAPKGDGFEKSQSVALVAYAERDRLMELEKAAFSTEKTTLRSLCANVEAARSVADKTGSEIRAIRNVANDIDRWWMLTTSVSSELAAQYPTFAEADYPLDEFPDLGWNGSHAKLGYDRGTPVLNGARTFHRIDIQLQAINELADFVDAELVGDAAKSSLQFVRAVFDATVPSCEENVKCIAPLKGDLIAAQGHAARTEALRLAALARFRVTLDEIDELSGFEDAQASELLRLKHQIATLRRTLASMEPLITRAFEQARRTCLKLSAHTGESLRCDPEVYGEVLSDSLGTTSALPWTVRDHVFHMFNLRVPEPAGYGAYTYVLFSKRTEAWTEAISNRYTKLLEAIVDNTDSASEAVLERGELNLFAIPTHLECEKDQSDNAVEFECEKMLTSSVLARDLKNYDPTLSRGYLAKARGGHLLRPEIMNIIRNSPGPFLLTTPERLTDAVQREGYGPLLFLDLSRFEPNSYTDVVNGYKATVVDEPPSGQVIWEPPAGVWIQNAVLSMGEHLPNLLAHIRGFISGA